MKAFILLGALVCFAAPERPVALDTVADSRDGGGKKKKKDEEKEEDYALKLKPMSSAPA